MKLPDFIEFEPFNQLRRDMGAESLGHFEFFDPNQHLTADERKSLELGIDMSIHKIRVLQDNTLAFKNSRIIVYCSTYSPEGLNVIDQSFKIPSQGSQSSPGQRNNYHIANCKFLQKLMAEKRDIRVGTRLANIAENIQPEKNSCQVCLSCLQTLRFRGFDGIKNRHQHYSKQVFEDFTLESFFSTYPSYPIENKNHNNLL